MSDASDFMAKRLPGEPAFALLGRDRASPITIKIWCHLWQQEIALGLRPESDRPQIRQALDIATAMEIWHREHRNGQSQVALDYDDEGRPTTGPHARKDRNTTSGAND